MPQAEDQALPSLGVLEEFSRASLAKWRAAGRDLRRFSRLLFFDLERHRASHSDDLLDAIRSSARGPFEFRQWARLVDYQFTNEPLSIAGSIKRDGGRFNIGSALNPATYTPFPALYLAEDFETAFRERFGIERSASRNGLTAEELALRRANSFSSVVVSGLVETVIDIGDLDSLQATAQVLRQFQMPHSVARLARSLRLKPPGLVRTASGLQRQLLNPNWRVEPAQYDLPSNSQIFGRLCLAAGVDAILYPSTKNGEKRCLALFPQNWRPLSSYIEVDGPHPPETNPIRIG